jgi:hypothetical protein
MTQTAISVTRISQDEDVSPLPRRKLHDGGGGVGREVATPRRDAARRTIVPHQKKGGGEISVSIEMHPQIVLPPITSQRKRSEARG